MSANQFGKLSKILLRAKAEDGKTFLEDVYFTAPFKIMRPFPRENGGIRVMQMAASAGIMEGDCQELEFDIGTGADLEFVSQSYDKIHEMKEGCARRTTKIRVHSGAAFCFHPQPTIPFKDSAFESRMEIHLDDETSVFSMSEILSCGRYAGRSVLLTGITITWWKYTGEKLLYIEITPAIFPRCLTWRVRDV